jgi:hypothetical protein
MEPAEIDFSDVEKQINVLAEGKDPLWKYHQKYLIGEDGTVHVSAQRKTQGVKEK